MNNISICLAKKEDCKELSMVKLQCWKETYSNIYPKKEIDGFDINRNIEKFANLIDNEGIKFYVVKVNNRIVGYMCCGAPIRPYKDYKHEIGLLYLLKEVQGLGLGTTLFNLAKQELLNMGAKEFFISCNKYNEKAKNFYLKFGGVIDKIDEDAENRRLPQIKFIYKL